MRSVWRCTLWHDPRCRRLTIRPPILNMLLNQTLRTTFWGLLSDSPIPWVLIDHQSLWRTAKRPGLVLGSLWWQRWANAFGGRSSILRNRRLICRCTQLRWRLRWTVADLCVFAIVILMSNGLLKLTIL